MGLLGKKKRRAPVLLNVNQQTLHKNLEFAATEQYKLLRTNLKFTLPEDVKCPIIGVTSSIRGEGKSTTAVNLSYVLAEKGSRVLLIDGDLRIPSIAKKMRIKSVPGLTDLLMGEELSLEAFRSELQENWYILPSGEIPPNPSELLGSRRMETVLAALREQFDYIIIDLPPVNLVSDAVSIAGLITGMVLVVREFYTEKGDLDNCVRQLRLSNVNVLGCVMNESESGKGSYSRYGKYKKYKYYKYYHQDYQTEATEAAENKTKA